MRTAEPFGWKTEKEGWYHIIPCTWKIPSFLHKIPLQLYWNTVLLASKIDSHSCMLWSSRRYMTLYLYLKRVLIFISRIETVGSLTYSQQTNSTNRLQCDSLPRSKEHKVCSVHALIGYFCNGTKFALLKCLNTPGSALQLVIGQTVELYTVACSSPKYFISVQFTV